MYGACVVFMIYRPIILLLCYSFASGVVKLSISVSVCDSVTAAIFSAAVSNTASCGFAGVQKVCPAADSPVSECLESRTCRRLTSRFVTYR